MERENLGQTPFSPSDGLRTQLEIEEGKLVSVPVFLSGDARRWHADAEVRATWNICE